MLGERGASCPPLGPHARIAGGQLAPASCWQSSLFDPCLGSGGGHLTPAPCSNCWWRLPERTLLEPKVQIVGGGSSSAQVWSQVVGVGSSSALVEHVSPSYWHRTDVRIPCVSAAFAQLVSARPCGSAVGFTLSPLAADCNHRVIVRTMLL